MSDTYIDKILQLRPVEFRYISNHKKGIGFIAEEVDKIIPEIVKRSQATNTIESIDYQFLVAPLVKIIQQQQEDINKLKLKLNM